MIFDRGVWLVSGHYVLGAIVIVFINSKIKPSNLKVAGFYFAIYNEETNF